MDKHPPLATRAIADLTGIARPWRRGWRTHRLNPDPRQAAELRRLVERAAAAMGEHTTRRLLDQLG